MFKQLLLPMLVVAIVLIACSKESEPVAPVLSLHFQGKVINAQTGQPLESVPVYTYYGTKCCGTIDYPAVGFAKGVTNAAGEYDILVAHTYKPTPVYRYFVGLTGPGEPVLKPFEMASKFDGYFTTKMTAESYALPGDLQDSVKITDGAVWKADFEVLPAGEVELSFASLQVPLAETWRIRIYGIADPAQSNAMGITDKTFFSNSKLDPFKVPVIANAVNYVETTIERPTGNLVLRDTLPTVKHREIGKKTLSY